MYANYVSKQRRSNKRKHDMNANFQTHLTNFAEKFQSNRSSKKQYLPGVNEVSVHTSPLVLSDISISTNELRDVNPTPLRQMRLSSFKTPTRQLQMEQLTSSKEMHLEIANWIHCKGLPFSTADCNVFKSLLQLARLAPPNYGPPSRNDVAGELLDINFEAKMEHIVGKNLTLYLWFF